MRKKLLPFFLCISLGSFSQSVTFEDGTTVNVNNADFNYENIRRASLGPVIHLDGLAGSKLFTVSYLNPEKFHLAANIGFSSLNGEATIFFTGATKEKEKGFAVKYEAAGYNTIKKYVLQHSVSKRKEWGVYLAYNDFGHLLKETADNKVDYYTVNKQSTVYAGISTVNYWHADINVDDNFMKRGQYTGRVVLAPFITFGSVADSNYTKQDIPRYGARLFYELSNTFSLLGSRTRGRTNMLVRLGLDAALNDNKRVNTEILFGFGLVYNFL